ncbi:orotate phosphoribosyltransferase [candidate division KSB1 bacterium]|nr:orotate phosphoribosyltransferase [candidate division KSB1 bacterium]TDI85890.1 MAG: orotate phosphoribosyltransferase [Caldithrix sp.]
MTEAAILAIFEETGALLSGHFILTSGLHSTQYFQCAQVLKHPDLAEKLCAEIARNFAAGGVELVVAPAVGGIIVAHEIARALGVPALFTEREDGTMTLRRGFEIRPGQRVLVAEDVITTGGSVKEVIALVKKAQGEVVGVGCLLDRSGGSVALEVPYKPLLSLQIKTYAPDDPDLKKLGPAVKPGSRSRANG